MVNKYPQWVKLVFGHQRYAHLTLNLGFRSLKENLSFQLKEKQTNPKNPTPPKNQTQQFFVKLTYEMKVKESQ